MQNFLADEPVGNALRAALAAAVETLEPYAVHATLGICNIDLDLLVHLLCFFREAAFFARLLCVAVFAVAATLGLWKPRHPGKKLFLLGFGNRSNGDITEIGQCDIGDGVDISLHAFGRMTLKRALPCVGEANRLAFDKGVDLQIR